MKILFHYFELIVWSLVNDTNSAYMLNHHSNYTASQLDMYSPFRSCSGCRGRYVWMSEVFCLWPNWQHSHRSDAPFSLVGTLCGLCISELGCSLWPTVSVLDRNIIYEINFRVNTLMVKVGDLFCHVNTLSIDLIYIFWYLFYEHIFLLLIICHLDFFPYVLIFVIILSLYVLQVGRKFEIKFLYHLAPLNFMSHGSSHCNLFKSSWSISGPQTF